MDLRQQVLLQEGKRRLEMEKLSLIDVSSEDDSLIFSPSASFVFPISFDQVDDSDEESLVKPIHSQGTHEDTCGKSPASSWSLEPNRELKVGRYNLRKSLAWDSAFFTSEGVLNCEELSILNKTFKRTEPHILPEISEDSQSLAESGVPVESETLALKDLEVDLFKQMLIGRESEGGGTNNDSCLPSIANSRTASAEDEFICKSDLDANTRVKKLLNPKSHSASRQKSEKIPMDVGESVKDNGKECKPSMKPPKTLAKGCTPVSAAAEKKILVASKSLRRATQKAAQGSCTPMAKPSPRSPSSGKKQVPDSASSLEILASISSDSSENMSVKGARFKKETRNDILSAHISSNSKLCRSVSPVRSIDSMSSDSSSSTCSYRASHRLKGITRISSRPFTGMTGTNGSHSSNVHTYPADKFSCVNMASPAAAADDSSTACPKSANSPSNSNLSKVDCVKPSGLRRPSPKIGFFDVATNPQGRYLSVLPSKLVAHNSSMNNSGSGSSSNLPRCATGLGSSDKFLKSQVNKPQPIRSSQQIENPHLQLHASASPPISSTNSPASQVTACAKVVESRPSISKIQKPSSIKISKRNSQIHLNDPNKHSQVSNWGSKGRGPPPEIFQVQSASLQPICARKDENRCDEANLDDNGEKVASSSSSENQALFDKAEQHDLRADHVEHHIRLCNDTKAGKDPAEQVLRRPDSLTVSTIVENRPSGRNPLVMKHLSNNNRPASDLKYKDKAIVELQGQENIVSKNSCEDMLKNLERSHPKAIW